MHKNLYIKYIAKQNILITSAKVSKGEIIMSYDKFNYFTTKLNISVQLIIDT